MADTSTPDWKLLYEGGRQALQLRQLQDAEQSFSAALQVAEDFPAGDPRLAATLNALARIYSLQRRYLAAAALLNRLLEVTERTLGPTHVQVAGVLTNLAEMYTHLGAAREELELRERVMAIRAGDPNADAASVARLRERVTELRLLLASQEPVEEADAEPEMSASTPSPVRSTPSSQGIYPSLPTPATSGGHPARTTPASQGIYPPLSTPASQSVYPSLSTPASHSVYSSLSAPTPQSTRSAPSVLPSPPRSWSGVPSTPPADTRPVRSDLEPPARTGFTSPTALVRYSSGVPRVSVPNQPARSSLETPIYRTGESVAPLGLAPNRKGSRSHLYSIAAGALLVAGVLAARAYVTAPDDESVSAGSVNLANVAAKPAVSVRPVAAVPDAPTVENLVAQQRRDRDGKRSTDRDYEAAREADRIAESERDPEARPKPPRAPAALTRALRGVDGALKSIDERSRAAAESAMAIRMQAPAFKKVKLADP